MVQSESLFRHKANECVSDPVNGTDRQFLKPDYQNCLTHHHGVVFLCTANMVENFMTPTVVHSRYKNSVLDFV